MMDDVGVDGALIAGVEKAEADVVAVAAGEE